MSKVENSSTKYKPTYFISLTAISVYERNADEMKCDSKCSSEHVLADWSTVRIGLSDWLSNVSESPRS